VIRVRAATRDDADAMSDLLIASITRCASRTTRTGPSPSRAGSPTRRPRACSDGSIRRNGIFVAERDGTIAATGGLEHWAGMVAYPMRKRL
jgi:hypothetical protein